MRIEKTHSVSLYKIPSETAVWLTYCRDCSKIRGNLYTCDEVARRFPQRMADAQYKYGMDYLKKNKSVDTNVMALSKKAQDTSKGAGQESRPLWYEETDHLRVDPAERGPDRR
jgi:hypothetical protein